MSQENVEIVRGVIEGWNQAGVEGVVGVLSPDWIGHPFPEWPTDTIYCGRDGFAKLAAEWTQTFDEVEWRPEKLIDHVEAVVALTTLKARIRGSGIPISMPVGGVFTSFADGMVGEVRFFMTWAEAIEAAGLPE
jgi:hypothetical protein